MFTQSWVCQTSIKNSSTRFLTLSKLFANFDFKSYIFININLLMDVAINITLSQSSINSTCFNHVGTIILLEKIKVVLVVKVS